MIRLAFLIRSLDYGGTQKQLVTLARALSQNHRFEISVLAFYGGQPFERELEHSEVKFISLEKRGRWDLIGFLCRLIRQVRIVRPDIVHSYLDIPNLLALFLKPLVGARVVWGIRASTIELEHYDWLHSCAARLERLFSRFADLIIVNSKAGRDHCVAQGFSRAKLLVIPNGFDTERLRPDREARLRKRREWDIPAHSRLVGIVGRLDPMKDHHNFLQAAAIVAGKMKDVRFVCVGDGPNRYAQDLKARANSLGLARSLIWQDATTNVQGVFNALDVLVSSSLAESLPNVVGEAMACGVPCVVTKVGDSRWLVGDCGIVVPPQDAEALAEGIIRCLGDEGREISARARARIAEGFGVQKLAERTEAALKEIWGR